MGQLPGRCPIAPAAGEGAAADSETRAVTDSFFEIGVHSCRGWDYTIVLSRVSKSGLPGFGKKLCDNKEI
jgi:hypothetical protein